MVMESMMRQKIPMETEFSVHWIVMDRKVLQDRRVFKVFKEKLGLQDLKDPKAQEVIQDHKVLKVFKEPAAQLGHKVLQDLTV